jgi:hypothetical protein
VVGSVAPLSSCLIALFDSSTITRTWFYKCKFPMSRPSLFHFWYNSERFLRFLLLILLMKYHVSYTTICKHSFASISCSCFLMFFRPLILTSIGGWSIKYEFIK